MSRRTTFLDPWIENRIWSLKICFINTHPPIHQESFACCISSIAQRPQRPQGRTVDLSREKTTALSCQASLLARVKESNTRRLRVREARGQVQKGVITVEMSVFSQPGGDRLLRCDELAGSLPTLRRHRHSPRVCRCCHTGRGPGLGVQPKGGGEVGFKWCVGVGWGVSEGRRGDFHILQRAGKA